MEYFFYASKQWCDLDKIKKYCVQYYNDGVAKVAFDDNSYSDFIDAIGLSEYAECHETFMVFGADGYNYELTISGTVKVDKLPPDSLKQILRCQKTRYKKYLGDLKFKEKTIKRYSNERIVKQSIGINGYDKYVYISKADLMLPL